MDTLTELPSPRVVVVGGGMAGLAAVRALRRARVAVQLIDTHNYTAFPPLLFQVATCFLAPTDVARPIRGLLRRSANVSFLVGSVAGVDWTARRVLLDGGDAVAFDYLVLAPGVVPSFAGVPGAAEHTVPLKTVADAARLRNRLLRCFETAAAHPDRAQPQDTAVVVVGGGPTGVELSGYIANFLFQHQFTSDYPQIDPATMRMTLVECGDRLLAGLHPSLSAYVLATLRKRGVEVRLTTRVVDVDAAGVALESGERIPAATVVWAGGVEAPAWVRRLGVSLDSGRVVVDADMRLPGHAEAFAVGDVAAVRARSGGLYPQLAQVAIQTGRHAGRQVRRLLAGRRTEPFAYFDKGKMAIVGRNAAVVEAGPVRLTGRIAWIAWGFLHVSYLPGAVNRMTTGFKYLWWHVTHENANRVLMEDEPAVAPAPQVRAHPA